jgi:hypothetical protein
MSTVIDATRPVDVRRLEFDPEDFIAFAAPFLRHGWRLAAGNNLYWPCSWGPPRYSHTILLFRITSAGEAEYRELCDYMNNNPIPRSISIDTPDDRIRWHRMYSFVHFSTLFPGVKSSRKEQKEFDIDECGKGETWTEDEIDESYIKAVFHDGKA